MVILDDDQYNWHGSMTIATLLSEVGILESCYIVKLDGVYFMKTELDQTYVLDNSSVYTVPLIGGG